MSETKAQTIYEICIDLAKQSPCQKRGFGTVLIYHGSTAIRTFNTPIAECTSNLCEPECIRFQIPSGSDSMIGACGHSEEHAIWSCIRKYGTAEGAILYVAGVDKDDEPLVKDEPFFYCVRCATLMLYSGVEGVNVYVGEANKGKWHFFTPKEAYESAIGFALKDKEVKYK